LPANHDGQAIVATGGEGGAGRGNQGGASGNVEKAAAADACPPGYPTTGANACLGHVDGAGGDGGPGLIQLHTSNGLAGGDILLPAGKALVDVCKPTPIYATATQRLVPIFGRNSTARSVWIPIGLGGFDPNAVGAPFFKSPMFTFLDTDPVSGLVKTTNGVVNKQPPIIGPNPIVNSGQGLPFISPTEPRTIVMDAAGLIGTPNEVYLQNLGLTQGLVGGGIDGKILLVTEAVDVLLEELHAQGMKGRDDHPLGPLAADQLDHPFAHFPGRLVGEGHRQDGRGRHLAPEQQVSDAIGDDPGLAGTGPGEQQQGAEVVLNGGTLFGVKGLEIHLDSGFVGGQAVK
jgi:hypothetical protein